MGTLNARNLTQALSQARNIGLVEEPFELEGISLTVRNLRPEQYDSIFKECQGLSDVEYLNAWQMAHVCRAICEINGIDFRDTSFVEEEEPDPKRPNQTRTIKVELHTWLQKNLLSGWSREVIYTCYRKVADAIESGERRAKEGVNFKIVDETAEDKFRRLIVEMKEIEEDVPEKVLDGILRDHGYIRRSTVDEVNRVESKLAALASDTPQVADSPKPAEPEVQEAVKLEAAPVEERQTIAPEPPSGLPSAERIAELLRSRRAQTQQAVPQAAPVYEQPIQPTKVEVPPMAAAPLPIASPPQGRSAELASIEGDVGDLPHGATNLQPQTQTPEVVLGGGTRLNPEVAKTIVDTPPVGGINPRFRPPNL